jgi:hypothetical protein
MPRLELLAFRYRDSRTGKWVRARYRAERHEIEARYTEWEITGPREMRDVDPDARYFTPHSSPLDAALRRYSERPLEPQPAMFLRRYVTYCARRGGYAAMNGAARLFAEVRSGD